MSSSEAVNNSRFTVFRLEFALQSQILRHIQTHSHQLFQTSTHTFDTLANHLPGQPGQAGTRMSPFWILLELRQMKVMATTGAIRDAMLQSNCHYQQTNAQLTLLETIFTTNFYFTTTANC